MVKRALCVGCNYPNNGISLSGAVNDAFLVADCLHKHYGFEPEDIRVLHDVYPGQARSSRHLVDQSHRPTRINILRDLRDLVRGAQPGDVLFFSFSGFGVQVDDLSAPQGEGLDDAILPTDFAEGGTGACSVVCTSDIHDILMGVPHGCAVTVVMDCDHSASIVDVSGTLEGKLIDGLKLKGFCGHATKMQLSSHRPEVWQDEKARAAKAMPRFQPMVEVDNPHQGQLPTRPAMSRSSPVAFCFSAASHGQTALELEVQRSIDGSSAPRQHGVLTWAFSQAVERVGPSATYVELAQAIRAQMRLIQLRDLPSMDQDVLLTFSTSCSKTATMRVLHPMDASEFGGRRSGAGQWASASKAAQLPQVVPPPPPGLISRTSESRSPEERSALALAGIELLHAALEGQSVCAASTPPAGWGSEVAIELDPAWDECGDIARARSPAFPWQASPASLPAVSPVDVAFSPEQTSFTSQEAYLSSSALRAILQQLPEHAREEVPVDAARAAFLTCESDMQLVRAAMRPRSSPPRSFPTLARDRELPAAPCGGSRTLPPGQGGGAQGGHRSTMLAAKARSTSPSSTCSTCDAASLVSSASEDEVSLAQLPACWGAGLKALIRRALPGRRTG
mmetsp:Transcript_103737/g.276029  ORF Transcript_103737/g.276029 Transcript_103737/m.276029 type:complete len:621 (-) Transcript_103737:127-1989(-)